MGMFDNYDNLDIDYIPDNSSPKHNDKYEVIDNSLPHTLYNLKGEFIGYSWNYGDRFDLKLNVNYPIKVHEDAIVYTHGGEHPTEDTIASYTGQQAYNIFDNRSWTYVGKSCDFYIWVEDEVVTYPLDGEKSINMFNDIDGHVLTVDIFNFRWEHVYSFAPSTLSHITCPIDEEVSKLLVRGLYNCTMTVSSANDSKVQNKFVIIIN